MRYWLKAFKKNAWQIEYEEVGAVAITIAIVIAIYGAVVDNYWMFIPFVAVIIIFGALAIYTLIIEPVVGFIKDCKKDVDFLKDVDRSKKEDC